MIERVLAPWNLKGRGYILIYKFNKNFVQNECFLPPFLNYSFRGGFGAIMLIDYHESNVGPYQELLFIPGKFDYNGRKSYSITKIYVSSMESVVNGRENWGIPKQLANFNFNDDFSKISVDVEGIDIFNFNADYSSFKFPISTKLLSFPLIQRYNKKDFYTKFSGKGKARFAKINDLRSNPTLFPDVRNQKRLFSIRIEDFNITFPKANIQI
ncbi:MAG: acetoacetate decarboxylase family protein [Thermotogota bacterium]